MAKLFTEYPYMESERLVIRKMTQADALALQKMTQNERVYKYLPTFLYECKYEDKREVIDRMDAECFEIGESILLGIYLKRKNAPKTPDAQEQFIGIAEIYNYEEAKAKASIGVRLDESAWGQGIATEVIGLLKQYLMEEAGIQTITAHIMRVNGPSAGAAQKNGFLCKYPDLYGDWGFDELTHTDKYVFKREWMEEGALKKAADGTLQLPEVHVEQFVMAYEVEQDRIRAMLPEGFESLRPVLRINAEIRDENKVYIELNTPVESDGRRGWLNIDNWKSTRDEIAFTRENGTVTFTAPFLTISFQGTGREGGCPAEADNEGCFYIKGGERTDGEIWDTEFRPAEPIDQNKEYCDCTFAWHFDEPADVASPRVPLTAAHAAAIPCRQVLGAYAVRFVRRTTK